MAIFSTTGSDTYPVGHIVQTTVPVRGVTHTAISTSMVATVVTGAITPQNDDSAILIHANFGFEIYQESSSDIGFGYKVLKTGTGVTTAAGSPVIGPITQDQGHSIFYRNAFQYVDFAIWNSDVLVDNDCETTNAVTYTVHAITYGVDGGARIGDNGWNNIQWSIWFQEIKR